MNCDKLDSARLARYIDVLAGDIAAQRLPGAVVWVRHAGQLRCFEALGRLAPGDTAAMPHDALFRIHSMTKPIVSLAALMLMEQGVLHAAQPLARYVAGFDRAISLHDLLRHSAGLSYEFAGDSDASRAYVSAGLARRDRSTAEFVATLAGLPLACPPGTAFEYSRATDVLGRVLEVASGESLGAHLKRCIFEPLAMHDTGFSVPADQARRIAEPFLHDAESGQDCSVWDPREPPRFESGGGGLLSTAPDYARFIQLLAARGIFDGVRLVSPKTIEWMTADHLGGLPRRGTVLSAGWGFGLGVAVRTHAGLAPDPGSVGSYGWSGKAGTIFFIDPAERIEALLMVQSPLQAERCWSLFRQMIHAALTD